jgi:hypothetical protein
MYGNPFDVVTHSSVKLLERFRRVERLQKPEYGVVVRRDPAGAERLEPVRDVP